MIAVNRQYNVPFLAGYSKDGKTIYIDRDMPDVLIIGDKKVRIVDFLLEVHEHIEKALEDCGLSYVHAHKFATTYEHYVAMKQGIDPTEYEAALKPFEREALNNPKPHLPPDLDRQPYVGDKNYARWFK